MYTMYILHSIEINAYYIGSTKNLDDRLRKHLSNHKGFTGRAKDWKVVYAEVFDSKAEALIREKQLKKWKNPARIAALILNHH